jgi:dTDP-glucose 4,6-dehydratase
MASILVTGSRSVIGTKVVKILKERGHNVFGIDMAHAPGEIGWEKTMVVGEATYARCDISEYRQLERVFEKCGPFEFVYHTAAEFGRWNGEDYYEQLWKTNAIGTKHLIRLQEKLGFKLIHFSSSEVYGDYDEIMIEDVTDNVPIKQMNDYAMTKWVNEMQIRNSRLQYNTQTVVVRLFNTYGPGEWYHPYRSVNSKFCYHALHGLPVVVHRGHFRYSTFLDDCCRTLANIVDRFKAGETYNIGGLDYHDIETLVDHVWTHSGADRSLITYKDAEPNTVKSKRVDTSKAVRELDHKLTVPLSEGVRQTIEWMRDFYKIPKP